MLGLSRPLLSLGVVAIAAHPGAQTADTPGPRTFLLRFDESVFPERLRLLKRLRRRIRAGATDVSAIVEQLRSGCYAARPSFGAAVAELGGEIRFRYWVVGGAAVVAPYDAENDLAAIPGVVEVVPDRVFGADIGVSTNSMNHNADFAQGPLGLDGAGVALAVLDSGTDQNSASTGAPHPAFTSGGQSRIAFATDIGGTVGTEDLTGHGTAVAGIALARDWQPVLTPSDDGFAPEAELCSYTITKDLNNDYDLSVATAAWNRILADRAQFGIAVANFSYKGIPSPMHLTQMTMDRVGHFGDILIVTSAGNDGDKPIPTQGSQSNANGLSVGSVLPDTGLPPLNRHVVSSFSSYGPLLDDPERFFPDLVAVGEGLITPAPDLPQASSWPPLEGTSFAAPAVAGTALLLRAARADLSAIDTKAVILNSVQDIRADNPALTRSHFGLGLLRTDLAAQALTTGQVHRGQLTTAAPNHEILVDVVTGSDYAATVVWPRVDTTVREWDDLELTVIDSDGRTIGMSASPRNLYERVLFKARHTAKYRLRIGATTLRNDNLPWSLAFGPNQGGGKQPGNYEAYGSGCARSERGPTSVADVPVGTGDRWGSSRTNIPLAYFSTRTQQAYLGTAVPNGLRIDRIALRRDEASFGAKSYQLDLQLFLGHTDRPPHALRLDYGNSIDDPMTEVIDNVAFDMPGTRHLPPLPTAFDYVLAFDRPFVTDTGPERNLLFDFWVYSHTAGNQPFGLWFDAETSAVPQYGMVSSRGNPFASQGRPSDESLIMKLLSGDTTTIHRLPHLDADRGPQLGAPFFVVLRDAPAGLPAALVHGRSDTAWGAMPLPFALDSLGAPSCSLLASPDFMLPGVVQPNGQLQFRYDLPNDAALTGAAFYNQVLMLDPLANPLGLSVTNAGAARIGG